MATTTTNLGVVTAYGDAVAAGYTGTKAEWQTLMASYATVAETAQGYAEDAQGYAGNASTYATNASNAKTAAQNAQTAAETAQGRAEDAQEAAESARDTVQASASQIAQNTSNISQLNSDISDIVVRSSNRLNLDAITENTYINVDGSSTSSQNFSVTDYIPVTAGETIYFWSKRTDNSDYLFDARFLTAYDSNKTAVSASGGTFVGGTYTVPTGIAYIRLSISNTYLSIWTNFYVGTLTLDEADEYLPYGAVKELINQTQVDTNTANIATNTANIASVIGTYSVTSGGSILEGVKYCYANNIKNLIVEAGTYDIISEYESYYGETYFDDYIDYAQGDMFDAGIWLQNISVKFSAGAKVVCHYTGSNANVPAYFSAFATGNNVTIDGLVLDAENLRYGIHADYNSGTDETFFIVKNCDLKHYKNSTSMQAIGAGFGIHVLWQIENTIFRSAGGDHIVFRVHNNVNSDAQSKMIVKDCYIDGDGYFKFNAYSTSTLQSIIQVCGCSYKVAPVVGKETSDSNDNFTMIAWNNELRS